MPNVYLAGIISGIPYEETIEWREEAQEYLSDFGIKGISPMRGKAFLKGTTFTHDMYHTHTMTLTSSIITRDRFDVMNCDMMLLNLNAGDHIGRQSCIEIGWADGWRKPIVLVDSKGIAPPLIQEMAEFNVEYLEDGLAVCVAVLT